MLIRIAKDIANKYSVDLKGLLGRGKSAAFHAARRELVVKLLENGFEEKEIAKFLGDRHVGAIDRLKGSYNNRDDNQRKTYQFKKDQNQSGLD